MSPRLPRPARGAVAPYETFRVDPRQRAPLVELMVEALRASGCAILNRSPDDEAPFRLSYITPAGERQGIVAYAFYANTRATRNRPSDEWRFQLKYGARDGRHHALWQDPFGLYTTLCVGISPEEGFLVGADPVLNSPTRLFISKEFKQRHVDAILRDGWHAWERFVHAQRLQAAREADAPEDLLAGVDDPVESFGEGHEVLVGATADRFLDYVRLEREALGEDQGHRQLVAEQLLGRGPTGGAGEAGAVVGVDPERLTLSPARLHALEREFELDAGRILELIASAPRLKMAVRGWVAEEHLRAHLEALPEVAEVRALEADGQPDFAVRLTGADRLVRVECKNVLRHVQRDGRIRLDFMRTRASPTDPCSRYYTAGDFEVVAACLHARTERWEFAARRTAGMAPHRTCAGRLDHRVAIDEQWSPDLATVLREATSA